MDAVIFDIDGTLLHSIEIDETLFRQAISSAIDGVEIRPLFSDYEHVTDAGIVSQIMRENSVTDATFTVETIKRRFLRMLSEHVATNGAFPAFPGARNYLQKFVESDDHAVGIATGCWRDSAVLKLNSAGLGDFKVPIATADDAMARIDIMQFALSQMPGRFDSITYYGDGEWDRQATATLGWNFVPVGATLGGLHSYEDLV
jgi:phosphoglycolate phosphatase-like HAD superfamily hydrolase